MTKYILHGGAASKDSENNKKFFMEITASLPNNGNVLLVCQAKDKERWGDSCKALQNTFLSVSPNKQINVELASDEAGVFINQLKNAHAVYLAGGNTYALFNFLKNVSNLEKSLEGKIVIGSSAGALVLAKYFYENDDDSFGQGLGVLPFKIFCHYSADRLGKMKELKAYKEDIEIKAITEEQFIVIEKNS